MISILIAFLAVEHLFWFFVAWFYNMQRYADIAWVMGIFGAIAITFISLPITITGTAIFILSLLWAMRLGSYLALRNTGVDDARLVKLIVGWGRYAPLASLLFIFMPQAMLTGFIALPGIVGILYQSPGIGITTVIGAIVASFGLIIESVADMQLYYFLQDPLNRGKLYMQGLWSYSRHPNYAGEIIFWWGIWVIALHNVNTWWSILGPLTITLLIRYVSGIPLLEHELEAHADFTDYKKRVPLLFPNLSQFIPFLHREND